MEKLKIDGLSILPLKQMIDDRGGVFHYLKSNSPTFKGFGEAYYSRINENVIKGWKFHHEVSQNFCVPYGSVKIVVFDHREWSPTKGEIEEVILDDNSNYKLLHMPPCLWYSFKCESEGFALLANIIDKLHNPDESENLPLNNPLIDYEWNR